MIKWTKMFEATPETKVERYDGDFITHESDPVFVMCIDPYGVQTYGMGVYLSSGDFIGDTFTECDLYGCQVFAWTYAEGWDCAQREILCFTEKGENACR